MRQTNAEGTNRQLTTIARQMIRINHHAERSV